MSLILQINQSGSWRNMVEITNLEATEEDLRSAVQHLHTMAPRATFRVTQHGDVVDFFDGTRWTRNPYSRRTA